MSGFLWKPSSERDGNLVVLLPGDYNGAISHVEVVDSAGNSLGRGNYTGLHNPYQGRLRTHWRFPKPGRAYPAGTRVQATLDNGQQVVYEIGNNTGRRVENINAIGNGAGFTGSSSGGQGSSMATNQQQGDGAYVPEGTIEGGTRGGVAYPNYFTNIPQYNPIEFSGVDGFPTIENRQVPFIDPTQYAKDFAASNREQITANYGQARGMALEALETELRGLQRYAPAAAALSRSQTALDNAANQAMREAQVNAAMPTARGTIAAQRGRAAAYAEGRLPDALLDRAREMGVRSAATDLSTYTGVGPRSMQAAKTSDLMSADARFTIAQYGEQLVTGNLATEAELFLAPTSYSQTGTQISPTPEVGAGRLAYQGLGAINEATLLSPAQALTTSVQQNQFQAQLDQSTDQFNAEGKFKASTFNAEGLMKTRMFNAQMQQAYDTTEFLYNVQYLSGVQASDQQMLNTELALQMQIREQEMFDAGRQSRRNSDTINSALESIGDIVGSTTSREGGASDVSRANPPAPATTPSADGGTVGGLDSGTPAIQQQTVTPTAATPSPTKVATMPGSAGRDASIPSGVRMMASAPVPTGYTKVANNPDGTYSAAPIAGYRVAMEQFARSTGVPTESINPANLAHVDRVIADAADLSYIPIQGFAPIATLRSGQQVFSSPVAATSGNVNSGVSRITSGAILAAGLGIDDPAIYDAMLSLKPDATTISSLDNKFVEGGEVELQKELVKAITGTDTVDAATPTGQRVAASANKLAELWGSLSPEQKSNALGAMAPLAVESRTGKVIGEQKVPGTEGAVYGELNVQKVGEVLAAGLNGPALARNWKPLSALANSLIGSDTNGREHTVTAAIAEQAGLLGFGAQGAAVPLEPNYLQDIGAEPAPQYGIGAAVFDNPALVPGNYKVMGQTPDGLRTIALPGNLVSTSNLNNPQTGPRAATKAGLVAAKKHPAQRSWGEAPAKGGVKGSAGGSAIISGMNGLIQNNPRLASSMMAYSMFKRTMG